MMLHAIDLHKRVLQVASMRADGEEVLLEARIPASREALSSYLAQWPGSKHRVVVETTGSWYWVADELRERNAELKLAHATKLEAITSAKVKTLMVLPLRESILVFPLRFPNNLRTARQRSPSLRRLDWTRLAERGPRIITVQEPDP